MKARLLVVFGLLTILVVAAGIYAFNKYLEVNTAVLPPPIGTWTIQYANFVQPPPPPPPAPPEPRVPREREYNLFTAACPSIISDEPAPLKPLTMGWIFLGVVNKPNSHWLARAGYEHINQYLFYDGGSGCGVAAGFLLRFSEPHDLVVLDFKRSREPDLSASPTSRQKLTPEDYTGQVLSQGTLVSVKKVDVSVSGNARQVWAFVVAEE